MNNLNIYALLFSFSIMINQFDFYNQQNRQLTQNPQFHKQRTTQPHPNSTVNKPNYSKKPTFLKPQNFNPFQIPPNLELAQLHRKATQFGKLSKEILMTPQNDAVCNCCGQQQKQQISFKSTAKQIGKINQSLGYYFIYIKILILMLAAILLISGIYTFITTLQFCHSNPQKCLYIYGMPFPSSSQFYNEVILALNVISAFLIYPFVVFLFYISSITHQTFRHHIVRASDLAVLIDGVDHSQIQDQSLIGALKGEGVCLIIYTHQIGEYFPMMAQRSFLQAKKNLFFKRGLNERLQKVCKQIYKLDEFVLPFKNKINLGRQRQVRTDKVIAKFDSVQTKQMFMKKYHQTIIKRAWAILKGKGDLTVNEVPLFIENLGEPQQILWQNLQFSAKYKYTMMLINSFVSLFMLAISFFIVLGLTHQQNQKQDDDDTIMSFILSIIIEAINFILYFLTFKLTEMEKRITLTGKMTARIIRNVVFFFFNTTLIPFSLFLINWYQRDRDLVLQYIISLFVVSNFVSPFTPLLSPMNFIKLYTQRKIKKQGKDCLYSQLQTNQIYQKFNFQLQLKYQLLSQRIMNCCFYGAIFPEVIIITILGMTLDYWLQKWFVTQYCCMPKYSFRLNKMINRISAFVPCIYLFGFTANLLMMKNQKSLSKEKDPLIIFYFAIFSLILSLLIVIGLDQVISKYLKKRPHLIRQSFSIIQQYIDYEQLNPTSFLHNDIQNTVSIDKMSHDATPFSSLQNYVIKRQCEGLRRDTTQISKSHFNAENKRRETQLTEKYHNQFGK